MSIGRWICKHANEDYLENLFTGGLVIEDVIFQILIECSRYAYLVNSEKHPWAYYIEQDRLELELARKNLKRVLEYSEEKHELEQKAVKAGTGYEIRKPEHNLSLKKGRFPSYEISRFQYWELNNIHDMKLVKSIVERRIVSSKKISNSEFRSNAEQYDKIVRQFIDEANNSDENMVFSSLALFTLQTKYSFDYFYKLACEMEIYRASSIPDVHDRLTATSSCYCGKESALSKYCPTLFDDKCLRIDYPLIIQRERMISSIVRLPKNYIMDAALGQFQEVSFLSNAVQRHICFGEKKLDIRTWFAENTNIEDWASVFEVYNVFRTFAPNKEWSDNKIKVVRSFYDTVSIDYSRLKEKYN